MPLTPLGRQLRSVLAGFRRAACDGSTPITSTSIHRRRIDERTPTRPEAQRRTYNNGAVSRQSAATASAVNAEEVSFEDGAVEPAEVQNQDGQRSVKSSCPQTRWSRNFWKDKDGIAEALRSVGKGELTQGHHPRQGDLSHANPRTTTDRRPDLGNIAVRNDQISRMGRQAPSLEGIISRHIRTESSTSTGQVVPEAPPHRTVLELKILASFGYNEADVKDLSQILSTADSLKAANLLARRIQNGGPQSVPFFVFSNLLRRPFISARALRVLLSHADRIIKSCSKDSHSMEATIFIVFQRFVRRAREAWPASFDRIAQLLLENLPRIRTIDDVHDYDHAQRLTHMLNKAMQLIALPTAIEPIRNNFQQERALVRILQFMASHTPTLQITREGYRAVIMLQLMQRKTQGDRQWAELKALSWPPWKEDRTAMDSFITVEDHGLSKAAGTLLRMREAGYRPLAWERTAMIYAGWDVDRTPTIQTLVHLGGSTARFRKVDATWTARITTTRTVQEAWAAFIAYQEATTARDQDVYLAILSKLSAEATRRFNASKPERAPGILTSTDESTGMALSLPGDVREIWPVPYSTHLHTYTRTPPPTVDEFYRSIRKEGFRPNAHFLGFLLANSERLKLGLQYLEDSGCERSFWRPLLELDESYSIDAVPMPLFVGFIELLSRFSPAFVTLPTLRSSAGTYQPPQTPKILVDRPLRRHTALVHAIALLQWRRPRHMPPYNAVLHALSRFESLRNLRTLGSRYNGAPSAGNFVNPTSEDHERECFRSAVTAHRLGQRVLSITRELHMDLDIDGFRRLCQIMENAAFATWTLMRQAEDSDHTPEQPLRPHLREAVDWMRSSNHVKRLRGEFRILVGDTNESGNEESKGTEASEPILQIPSFSLLHAYIRALGWMADYEGLLEAVRWMRQHAAELAARQAHDRNGETMLLRTLCALRAFLERSWLPSKTTAAAENGGVGGPIEEGQPRFVKLLSRLRAPAPEEVVEEIRKLVEEEERWVGWPSDEDVERYCRDDRFRRPL